MVYLLVTRHKVEDYEKFKSEFDGGIDMRKAAGEKSYQIFRIAENPNELVMLFEWDSMENARKFIESEELREAQKLAGVLAPPEAYFLEEVEKG